MESLDLLLSRTLVVVAHPDDECVACGALLQRISKPVVLYLTDGAPRDQYFWERFGSREAYAIIRQQEARRALEYVGVRHFEFANEKDVSEVFIDQNLYRVLPQAWSKLAGAIKRYQPQALFTLAYEGGHPDHDSCSLLVSVAVRKFGLPAWEASIYNRAVSRGSEDIQPQRFVRESGAEIDVRPSVAELERKRQMWRQYESQSDFLRLFSPEREIIRRMPAYDYSMPPHEGQLNYEQWQWPMTGADVCRAFVAFVGNLEAMQLDRKAA